MYVKTPIEELSVLFIKEYKKNGYSPISIASVEKVVSNLVFMHQQQNEMFFSEQIIDSFITKTQSLHKARKMGRVQFLLIRRTSLRLIAFCKTGKLDLHRISVREVHAAPAFLALLDLFAENKAWSDSIRYHINYTARMHFEWLTKEGILDIKHVTHSILRAYLCHCSERLSGLGMKHYMFLLKKMYRYLFDKGYTVDSFEGILSFSVSVTKKFKPALTEAEVNAMFQSIDRTSAAGKRNYAVLLLAYVTGLRASDIASFKLVDIDWRNGEIHIIQRKTGHPLFLPLTEDVGSALKDYILNGRPCSESQNVFLCTKAPYEALKAQGSIASMYKSVRNQAGLKRKAFDGKSFHAFRRTVGKNMVVAGTPLTDIAQILGHANIESTQAYIPLDSESLKNCALGLDGVAPPSRTTVVHDNCALDFKGIDPASCKERIQCCALDFYGIEQKGGAQW